MEDSQARFETLFERHNRAIQAYCLRRAPVSDAYDAAAEVFAVAWRRRDAIPPADDALPWLYGVAAKVLSNQRRSRRRRLAFTSRLAGMARSPVPSPEDQAVRRATDAEVLEALASLHPTDREVVTLVAWEGLSREQAAAAMGCSVEAAKKRYQRAIRRLEGILGHDPRQARSTPVKPRGGHA